MERLLSPSSITFALFTPTLGAGGIQRAYINLGKCLASAGYNVVYIVSRAEGEFVEEVTASRMQLVNLNVSNLRYALFALRSYLKSNKIDYILSGPPYATFLSMIAVKMTGGRTRVLAAIHAYVNQETLDDGLLGRMIPRLVRMYYPKSHRMLAVTSDIKKYMVNRFKLNPDKIDVIYNLVIANDFFEKADAIVRYAIPDTPFIIAMGRLVKVKDYSMLLEAFKKVNNCRPDISLVIVGEGPEFNHLTSLASSYGVADRVIFTGMLNNPYPLLKKAALLVSSSTSESLGNTLVEALALQIPVVATATEGAKEVLANGTYGSLVPIGDSESLGEAIIRQLEKGPVFANERWKDFSTESIVMQYEKMFLTDLH